MIDFDMATVPAFCGREAKRNLKFTACLSWWTQRRSPRADAFSSPGAWESGGQSPAAEWTCQFKGGVRRLPERRVLGEGGSTAHWVCPAQTHGWLQ